MPASRARCLARFRTGTAAVLRPGHAEIGSADPASQTRPGGLPSPRRQRLVVEYAPKCQFDLVSLGHPLDPILDGRGPALRTIDHQPPEVSLAYSSGGAATNRLSVQAVHFFVVGRGHEMRERKGRSLNQHVIRLHCRSPGPRNHTLATRL